MATKAMLVVNKQLDATIDELTEAMRDALALWALPTDARDPWRKASDRDDRYAA